MDGESTWLVAAAPHKNPPTMGKRRCPDQNPMNSRNWIQESSPDPPGTGNLRHFGSPAAMTGHKNTRDSLSLARNEPPQSDQICKKCKNGYPQRPPKCSHPQLRKGTVLVMAFFKIKFTMRHGFFVHPLAVFNYTL